MSHQAIRQDPPVPERARPIVCVGAGGIVGDAHLPAYRKAGYEVQALVDLDQRKAQELAERFGVPNAYGTVEEATAVAPDDVVYDVAVPASAIGSVLERLPDRSAVLIQKPMGENLAQAGEILELARSKELVAAVNFQMRFAPYVLAARDLIIRGLLGDVHDVEMRITTYTPWQLWTFLERLERVEILYHSVHYIDLIRSLLGDPTGVYAKTLAHPNAPKIANSRSTIVLDYGDQARANIETNHGHAYGPRHQESYLKIEGTQGAVFVQAGLNLDYPKGGRDIFEYVLLRDGEEPRWTELPLEGSWFPDAFIGSMGSLQRYLEGSSDQLPTRLDDAIRTMAVVEAAYDSSRAGATNVPYPEGRG